MIPDFLPIETGDTFVLKAAADRSYLICRFKDGWTFIEDGNPANNGAIGASGAGWLVTIERAGLTVMNTFESWSDVEAQVFLSDR